MRPLWERFGGAISLTFTQHDGPVTSFLGTPVVRELLLGDTSESLQTRSDPTPSHHNSQYLENIDRVPENGTNCVLSTAYS